MEALVEIPPVPLFAATAGRDVLALSFYVEAEWLWGSQLHVGSALRWV
jgi:hypothetical protein